jgi:hypothetical protein
LPDLSSPRGMRTIILDPDRAPFIKQAFEKVYFNGWSGRDVYAWLKDSGFRTRSGKILGLSSIYRMLNNPYYCGIFETPRGSGQWFKIKHESIISQQLFEDVQEKLSVVPKTMPGTLNFDFTRILKCGLCGSGVTVERKIKRFKDGTSRIYIYYHCTQARNITCPNPSIREDNLLDELTEVIDQIPIEKIEAQERTRQELDRYQNFTQDVLDSTIVEKMKLPQINARGFAKYLIRHGSKEEKREMIACLNAKIVLKDKHIHLE